VSPLVEEILSRHRYFGDGPPHWRTRRTDRPCQSARDAENRRWRLLKRLRRYERQTGDEAASSLIDRLENCHPRHRCGSGACPECARAMQRWFVEQTAALINGPATILMPIAAGMQTTDLSTGNPTINLKRLCGRTLESAGIDVAAMGIDFSVNYDRYGTVEPHYMPHAWILVPQELSRVKLDRFFRWFPKTPDVPRPRRQAIFDGNLGALAYGLKPNFHGREGYFQMKILEGGERVCWNTRRRPLRAEHSVAIALMLDRIGHAERIMLRGARMTKTRDGVAIRRLGAP